MEDEWAMSSKRRPFMGVGPDLDSEVEALVNKTAFRLLPSPARDSQGLSAGLWPAFLIISWLKSFLPFPFAASHLTETTEKNLAAANGTDT
jgi:hypothetical protein